jgi:hypothetical protein
LGRATRANIKAELNIEFGLYKSKRLKQQIYHFESRRIAAADLRGSVAARAFPTVQQQTSGATSPFQ